MALGRVYSSSLHDPHERRISRRLRSLADYIQSEGPFDFIFSREGLRERSHPLMPQE